MRRARVIPVLLIQNGGLVKSIKFKKHQYVGDPINAVKIFNDKEVDEIVILNISAQKEGLGPNFQQVSEIASEAFMPLAYGGGISNLDQIKRLFSIGVEKVVLNSSALDNPRLIRDAANQFGNQSIVVSIDVNKDLFGRYRVYRDGGQKNTGLNVIDFAKEMENKGAGEIFLCSIDRDGTFEGYDIELIKKVASNVEIPVVACGGASSLEDMYLAIANGNASAVAAGSMFVLQRPHNAVLISYPNQDELKSKIFNKLTL